MSPAQEIFRRIRSATRWCLVRRRLRQERTDRQRRLVGRESLVAEIEALLFRHDPIGLNFEDNTDEYRAEAETIALRLPEAGSVADVRRMTQEEFVRWFDAELAGPESRYTAIAQEVWQLWHSGERSA